MADPKSCARCGCDKLWIENTNMAGVIPQWVVSCTKCFKRSKPQTSKNRAIEDWNRRMRNGQ